MGGSNVLLRIFWPQDLPRTGSPGVLVGWRNSESDIFVLTILEDVEVRQGSARPVMSNMLIVYRFEASKTLYGWVHFIEIAHILLCGYCLYADVKI